MCCRFLFLLQDSKSNTRLLTDFIHMVSSYKSFAGKRVQFSTLLASLFCLTFAAVGDKGTEKSCSDLRPGQYLCNVPEIDRLTQQPVGCSNLNKAIVSCKLAPGVHCLEEYENNTFHRVIDCHFAGTKNYRTALVLSIFLGWLGIDRFYLGYTAIGLFKLFTLGFMFIFHLLDVVLIALQIVGPADGTAYLIDYYGPRAQHIRFDNTTYIVPEEF